MKLRPLYETISAITKEQEHNADYVTTYGGLFSGIKQNGIITFSNGSDTFQVPKSVYNKILKDIGATTSVFNDKDVSEATRNSYIQDKLRSGWGDKEIVVRASGDALDGVVSTHYNYIDNSTLATFITQFSIDGVLPPFTEMYTSAFHMSKGARNLSMRIVSPDHWTFQNGDTYYGGVLITNNEIGMGAVTVQPAIARVSCFNYCIAEDVFYVPHRENVSVEEVQHALERGFSQISHYSELMFNEIQKTKSIGVDQPRVIFELVKEQMKLPDYVQAAAIEYWENEGAGHTLFDVNQALTFGTQELIEKGDRRRKIRWEERDALEKELWGWTQDIVTMYQEGEDVNDITSQYALLGKRKAIGALQQMGYEDAAEVVEGLEPDGYNI